MDKEEILTNIRFFNYFTRKRRMFSSTIKSLGVFPSLSLILIFAPISTKNSTKGNSLPTKKYSYAPEPINEENEENNSAEIKEIQERIDCKKEQLDNVEYELMNALNEIKELNAALTAEKEKVKELESENKQLTMKKEILEEENKKYNDDIMALLLDLKEDMQKQEEIWEYEYNELLCQQEKFSELM